MIKRLFLFISFVLITCIVAGVFGIFHDQATYSISSEYYTCFKFNQFGIGYYIEENNPRTGVFMIGFFATWWTGLIIGGVIGLLGIHKNHYSNLFKLKLKSLFVVFLTTICFSVIGYLVGIIRTSGMEDWMMNVGGRSSNPFYELDKITDFVSFIQVGIIHNFSYIGGLAGLIVGLIYNLRKSRSVTQN